MRPPVLLALALACGLLACRAGGVGERYRAERMLHRADAMLAALEEHGVPPHDPQWGLLGVHYEQIAERLHDQLSRTQEIAPAVRTSIRNIAATAGLRAVEVHGARLDSLAIDQILGRMAITLDTDDSLASEVARVRGAIAQLHGDLAGAIDLYRAAIARRAALPGSVGIDSLTLELPLEIARMSATLGGQRVDERAHQEAMDLYRAFLDTSPRPLPRAHALHAMAELAGDRGASGPARQYLQERAEVLRPFPGRSLEEARFEAFAASLGPDLSTDSLLTLAAGFRAPGRKSEWQARRRLVLGQALAARGRSRDGLALLFSASKSTVDPRVLAEIARTRAEILERSGERNEAQLAWRSLRVEYPVTEIALVSYLVDLDRPGAARDPEAAAAVLRAAEQAYRDFIARFPDNELSDTASRLLVEVLEREGRFREAITEELRVAELRAGTFEAAVRRSEAARLLLVELADTTAAREQYERVATEFAHTRVGRRARALVLRLGAAPAD